MKFLKGLFKKKQKPEQEIPLDALYFRLHIRENRMARWAVFGTDAPEVVVQADRVLIAKVKKEIEERHAKIKLQADEFGKS
jgi:hypothetical protein